MDMKKSKIYILKTRPLGISDLVFALRGKKASYSSLEAFNRAGLVIDLKPEWERAFVEALVETKPEWEKNFEHFLQSPPDNIQPTDIIQALRERSSIIPTLCVVYLQNGKPSRIEKVRDYYQLLSLLSDAKDDGLVESEGTE